MSLKSIKKKCIIALAIYILIAVLFYFVGGEQLHFRDISVEMLAPSTIVGEITKDTVVTQNTAIEGEMLSSLAFRAATYARQNSGVLVVEVLSPNGEVSAKQNIDISTLTDGGVFTAVFSPAAKIAGGKAQIRITAPDSKPGNAVTLYCGNAVSTARNQVAVSLDESEKAHVNGSAQSGALCMEIHSRESLSFGTYYPCYAALGFLLLAAYCAYLISRFKKGKQTAVLYLSESLSKYRYLMKQLVSRDFKTKYKRSVLGVLWSFLNPLLIMLVQYIVFSTLFKSDIPNFAVYLLIGIVCFSFFNEATTMSLSSIVGNASLITKVHVPKFIYPLTRVLSSTINFALSHIPLFAVLLITRTPIRPAILLLPFGVICLFALSLGIGLLLASAMVFFRDTQFLWGVISMLWMYATPIFYPESIISGKFITLFKMNPLYHIIRFIRVILLDGVSPEPKAYLLALIASVVPLIIGTVVFKKTQDRFVLNI